MLIFLTEYLPSKHYCFSSLSDFLQIYSVKIYEVFILTSWIEFYLWDYTVSSLWLSWLLNVYEWVLLYLPLLFAIELLEFLSNCSPFFFESLRVLYLLLVWSYMICIVTQGYFQSFIVILIWDLCLLFHVSAPSQMHSFCWCLLFPIHGILMQLELIRFIASDKPLVAARKVSERTVTIIENVLQSPIPAQVC